MGSLPSKSSSGSALSEDQSLIHHQPTTWKAEHYAALQILSSTVMLLWPQPARVSDSSFKVLSCHRFPICAIVNLAFSSSPTLPSSGFLKADFAVLWFFNYVCFQDVVPFASSVTSLSPSCSYTYLSSTEVIRTFSMLAWEKSHFISITKSWFTKAEL